MYCFLTSSFYCSQSQCFHSKKVYNAHSHSLIWFSILQRMNIHQFSVSKTDSLWHFDSFLHFYSLGSMYISIVITVYQSEDDDICDEYRLILILLTTVLRSSQKLLHSHTFSIYFIDESEGVLYDELLLSRQKTKLYFLLLLPFTLKEDELDFLTFTTWLIFYCCRF